jgi:beta-glucanase (GH16 family)
MRLFAITTTVIFVLWAFGIGLSAEDASRTDPKMRITPEYETGPSFLRMFKDGHDPSEWFKADFAYLGPVQRAGWEADHISFGDTGMELKITKEPKGELPNTGAEYQRRGRYGYGRYEVVMRAARGSGLVSSFFTHTGPSLGDSQNEIDIEFIGNRTEDLHINMFTDGQPYGSVWVPLPYDAAEEYQLYAFEWTRQEVKWFVGDQQVYRISAADHPLPVTPGRVIMNLWTGSRHQYGWHGRPTFQSGANAGYVCASFRAAGDVSARQCSDHFAFDLPYVEID